MLTDFHHISRLLLKPKQLVVVMVGNLNNWAQNPEGDLQPTLECLQ